MKPSWLAVLGGLALAIVMVLSPVTVWATIAMGLIVAMGARGRSGLERRLIIGIAVLAIVVRVAMISALFASTDHVTHQVTSFAFDGDGRFLKVRALWMRNIWLGVPVEPHSFTVTFDRYGWTSYFLVIAYLQYLLGAAPYAIHLFNVCCYVGGALLLHRTARAAYGAVPALVALVLILFMPTLMMWSAAALKESLYFLLTACTVWGLMQAARGRSRSIRLAGLACALTAVAAVSSVRTGALVIVTAGTGLALAGSFVTRRVYLVILGLALVAVFGSRLVDMAPLRDRVRPTLVSAASVHMGNVSTQGHSYRLLDDRFYSGDSLNTMTWPEAKRFVARALVSFVLVPLPQQATSRSELALVPQQVLWYGLVLFALAGVFAGCRRDTFFTWLLLGITCAGAGVIALNSGNVGTLVRIRDSIVPFVSCLAALGAVSGLSRVIGASEMRTARVQDGVA